MEPSQNKTAFRRPAVKFVFLPEFLGRLRAALFLIFSFLLVLLVFFSGQNQKKQFALFDKLACIDGIGN